MSDLMLYGVLRMPYDLTMANDLSRRQFYSRVQEAASRLEAAEAKLEELSRATPPSPSTAPTDEPWKTLDLIANTGMDARQCMEAASRALESKASTAPTVEVDERAATQILKSIIEDGYLSETNVGRYHAALASKPPAREAAERQSIDTPKFRLLVDQFRSSVAFNRDERLSALIAHINTWGGAAPATGNTAQPKDIKEAALQEIIDIGQEIEQSAPIAYLSKHVMEALRSGCHVATTLMPTASEQATEPIYAK